ncbi:ImmA/IrrE family metallo-endopeptidase [Streptomyces sp. NBC_00047]|uniref:ImmA/IrrE family metallo-endopeptidase n=1 Tax=Streptomyces sp. NBC_00047 TaxID=2975627 RepID=UPI00225057FE|nr:ImmA/IrrE family metallo-endopeptidase [Streptomyces sp. NBC_00047]MCX5608260.1 ImmA/IrrE family metallo-endopeptidase [Streptomyces sp. NBC_00047]
MSNNSAVRELYTAGEPDYAVPPGETILEFLEESDMTQREFAVRAGMSAKHLNQLTKGLVSLTPDVAEKLESVTGIRARFWNRLEADYQSTRQRLRATRDAEVYTAWYQTLPVKELVKRGQVPQEPSDKASRWEQLLAFFGVASLDAWVELYEKPAAAFRKTKAYEAKVGSVASWLRLGELAAQEVHCAPFNKSGLQAAIPRLRELTVLPPQDFESDLVQICARNGVAIVFVKEITGSRSSGAARWVSPTKAVVQLSLRYKTDDQFWFTVFHELGHVLLHGKQDVRVEPVDKSTSEDPQELEADSFASEVLIPSRFRPRLSGLKSLADTKSFAREIGIAPGIVVGRLHHDGIWPHSWGNALKRRFELVDEQAE